MPILHPDPARIPPHLFSEQEVLRALRTLPGDAHVCVRLGLLDETTNQDRELDFLVIHPELGLVIVEVKGRGVKPRGDHWIRRDAQGREHVLEETPGDQLRAQQYALLRYLQSAGLPFVPRITRVLALPALALGADQGLGPDLPACRILTKAKLAHPFLALREAVAGGAPWEAWRRGPDAAACQVRPDQLRALLEALCPRLAEPPGLADLLAAEGRLQDLANRTLLDHLAQNFSRGRYHVYGGPGSGKSLLARQVTRLWAAEGRPVLVLAFNRALTYATQTALDDLQQAGQAVVSTYHDLAATLLEDAGLLPPCEDPKAFFNQQIPAALARHLADPGAPARGRYGALVVDEAQDLEPEWIRPLLALLQDPDRDPVLVLEDPAQSLYREARHELGQPWRLDLSLRQHPALRRAACQAFPGCGWTVPEAPEGDDPVTRVASSPKGWRQDLAARLEALAREGIQPGQVMVLAPHRPATLGLADGQQLGPWPLNLVPDWWDGAKSGHLRVGTVHGFKGLEADVVVYLAPAYRHPDARRLAYTAYSRARHRLVVLEHALAEPVRPLPRSEPEPAPAPPPRPAAPPRPAVHSLGGAERSALLGALTAARQWQPGTSPREPQPW